MKFKTAAPITIGKTSYSTLDMVRFVAKNERRYNATAEAARQARRTIAAFEASGDVDLGDEDLRQLAEVLEKPSCGWGQFTAERDVPQRAPDGGVLMGKMQQRIAVPTVEFLPLIDPIADAAAKLPLLVKPQ